MTGRPRAARAGALLDVKHLGWQLEIAPRALRAPGTEPADIVALLAARFGAFVDLEPSAPGCRVRPARELPDALGYVTEGFTNLLLGPWAARVFTSP